MGIKYKVTPSYYLYFFLLFQLLAIFSCKKEEIFPVSETNLPEDVTEKNFVENPENFAINPFSYLATLTFDGKDNFDSGESNFPQSFNFNSKQDANGDGLNDQEDNLENLICYSIGYNLYGYGRTGLKNRGPNDQRPVTYFHIANAGAYKVYEYWLYYADNNWLNDHEHDWEKYFVYVLNNTPKYIKISSHNSFQTFAWNNVSKDYRHPKLGVDGGSHALKLASEDGVKIRYNGQITKNNGTLLKGNGKTIAWKIYSNDANVSGVLPFSQTTCTFYYGDPEYSTNANEFGSGNGAPWLRTEWSNPPLP